MAPSHLAPLQQTVLGSLFGRYEGCFGLHL